MRQCQATAWVVTPLPFPGILADALGTDGPEGSCCGGSGVRPLLPSPSEAADAPKGLREAWSDGSASERACLFWTQQGYKLARLDVKGTLERCRFRVGWAIAF